MAAACVGLAAILLCGVLIDGVREYPARWAMVPVGAAILVILAGGGGVDSRQPWPARLLGTAPIVTLGALAYALYL